MAGPPSLRPGPGVLHPHCSLGTTGKPFSPGRGPPSSFLAAGGGHILLLVTRHSWPSKPQHFVRGQNSDPTTAGPAPTGSGVLPPRPVRTPCSLSSPASSTCSLAPKTQRPCPGSAKWSVRLDQRGTKDGGLGRAWTVTLRSRGVPEGLQAVEGTDPQEPGGKSNRGWLPQGVPRSIPSESKEELVLSDAARWGLTPHLCHHHLSSSWTQNQSSECGGGCVSKPKQIQEVVLSKGHVCGQ